MRMSKEEMQRHNEGIRQLDALFQFDRKTDGTGLLRSMQLKRNRLFARFPWRGKRP